MAEKAQTGYVQPPTPQSLEERFVPLPCYTPRWLKIKDAWKRPILEMCDFENAIAYYRREIMNVKFSTLDYVVDNIMTDDEKKVFFEKTIPAIVEFALDCEICCDTPIPILISKHEETVTLNQRQVCALLANMFLCTFVYEEFEDPHGDMFPVVDFLRLFASGLPVDPSCAHKLRCVIHYFEIMRQRKESGQSLQKYKVDYMRRQLPRVVWELSPKTFDKITVKLDPDGSIESYDDSGRTWQSTFSNSYIGGGVLGKGCVQEEIRFVISPELIIAKILADRMDHSETMLIVGSERFCEYSGYGNSFEFLGNYEDTTEIDRNNRRVVTITCFDALCFNPGEIDIQFQLAQVNRELNKALCAFYPREEMMDIPFGQWPPVATGNWGCGAFGGDVVLKFIVQVMAAVEAGRDLVYLTFKNEHSAQALMMFHKRLADNKATVGDVFRLISQFGQSEKHRRQGGEALLRFVGENLKQK